MAPRLGIFRPSAEKNKGFTLLELMVVIAIIGALSAIGIPAYQGYVSDAREKEAKNTLQTIALQQKSFYSENFSYFFTTLVDVDQSAAINIGLFSSTSGPLQTTERLYNFWIINTGADPLIARTFRAVAQERRNTTTFFSIDQEMSKTSTINGTAGGSW
jgi:prepilin-type N-terminal cleavage/methylation domain-containing protein